MTPDPKTHPSACLTLGHHAAHRVVEFPEVPGHRALIYGCGRCGLGFSLAFIPTTQASPEVAELRERITALEAEVDRKRAGKARGRGS